MMKYKNNTMLSSFYPRESEQDRRDEAYKRFIAIVEEEDRARAKADLIVSEEEVWTLSSEETRASEEMGMEDFLETVLNVDLDQKDEYYLETELHVDKEDQYYLELKNKIIFFRENIAKENNKIAFLKEIMEAVSQEHERQQLIEVDRKILLADLEKDLDEKNIFSEKIVDKFKTLLNTFHDYIPIEDLFKVLLEAFKQYEIQLNNCYIKQEDEDIPSEMLESHVILLKKTLMEKNQEVLTLEEKCRILQLYSAPEQYFYRQTIQLLQSYLEMHDNPSALQQDLCEKTASPPLTFQFEPQAKFSPKEIVQQYDSHAIQEGRMLRY